KKEYFLEDLNSGKQYLLASKTPHPSRTIRYGSYYFDPEIFELGNQLLLDNLNNDLLVLDEFGPLELRGQGFRPAVDLILRAYRGIFLLAVRPSLFSDTYEILKNRNKTKLSPTSGGNGGSRMIPVPHVHIVGQKKSGKTALLEFLVTGFTRRGYRVGTLKHSSHQHPLDKSGSDSDRFSRAGANPSVFMTPNGVAIFYRSEPGENLNRYLSQLFSDCDLVLIEAFSQAEGPKILIQKDENDLKELDDIIAVVNNDGYHPDYTAFRPGDSKIIDFIIRTILSLRENNQ
ncbi:MAG: molybdopterin-guanine dinucleotide biosynthesis protein B, partial [Calditrichaeota bacterium]